MILYIGGIEMKISRYRIYKALIAGGIGIAVAIAITTNTATIALAAVIAGIVLALVVERRNKEVVRDERIAQINGKAATFSFYGMLILAAAVSLVTALFRSQLPENVVYTGSIMGYFVCVALVLHICFYAYFSRKL
jgi:uncharacterized membrane protein